MIAEKELSLEGYLGNQPVRIGNDALVAGDIVGIDLRHHQRHRVVHTKLAGIIDNHRSGFHRGHGKRLGVYASGAEQRDIPVC